MIEVCQTCGGRIDLDRTACSRCGRAVLAPAVEERSGVATVESPPASGIISVEWEDLEGGPSVTSPEPPPLTIEWQDLLGEGPRAEGSGTLSGTTEQRVQEVLDQGAGEVVAAVDIPWSERGSAVGNPGAGGLRYVPASGANFCTTCGARLAGPSGVCPMCDGQSAYRAVSSPRGMVSAHTLAVNIAEEVKKRRWFTSALVAAAIINAALVAMVFGAFVGSWLGALAVIGALILWCLGSYFFYSRLVLSFTGARPPRPEEMARMGPMVERMAARAGIVPPTVRIVDDDAANAFAVGLRPEKATAAFSTGLLDLLTDDELEGVAGHEISHIAEGDTRRAVYAAALVGWAVIVSVITTIVAFFIARMAWGMAGHGGDNEEASDVLAGWLVAAFLAVFAVMVFVFTQIWVLVSRLTDVAISRQREWLADARAAGYTQNPLGLARALEKLAHTEVALAQGHKVAQSLCIAGDPRSRRTWENLFSTHPPIEERIRRLHAMADLRPPG